MIRSSLPECPELEEGSWLLSSPWLQNPPRHSSSQEADRGSSKGISVTGFFFSIFFCRGCIGGWEAETERVGRVEKP